MQPLPGIASDHNQDGDTNDPPSPHPRLAPAPQPNQRHRAEIQKLIVATRARRAGVASALMRAAEAASLAAGRWLATLDTRSGSSAETCYIRWGYVAVGRVPDYAVDPDGVTFAPCTFFYKQLRVPAG